MSLKRFFYAMIIGCSLSTSVSAEQIWSSFSLSYLQGDGYEVFPESGKALSVEHASGHNWGDNFFFVDHIGFDGGVYTNYFELGPRISLSYLTSASLSAGPITDVYIATTWEGGDFNNFLLGLGVGVKIPGFKYFNVNIYQANNELDDDDEQLTLTWAVPFGSGNAEFLYDGFLDYSTESDTNAAEMNFTSQLKWNVGKLMDLKSPLYLGLEYAYWTNKFGNDGVDEKNPSLLVKWHF